MSPLPHCSLVQLPGPGQRYHSGQRAWVWLCGLVQNWEPCGFISDDPLLLGRAQGPLQSRPSG